MVQAPCGCIAGPRGTITACDEHGPRKEPACCAFFNVGNLVYKGVYLPSVEEYEAHGYDRADYDRFIEYQKRGIDDGQEAKPPC
jgi:hypothetical protein